MNSTAKGQCLVPDVSTDDDGGIGSRKGREKELRKDSTLQTQARTQEREKAQPANNKGNRRTVDAAATASARQVKEKAKEGKGKHEKKEKSHQATGRGKTERRKRGGGGGEGLETGATILWAATHQPLVARSMYSNPIVHVSVPGSPGLAGAAQEAQVPGRLTRILGRTNEPPPCLGPQHLPCVLPRRNPLRDTRMGRRRCGRCEPGEAHRTCVCVWLCFGQSVPVLVQGSSSRRPIRGRRRRSICAAPGSPRFQRTSWYLNLRCARH